MTIRITTDMLNALGGAYTAENVRRVRALLSAAGVADVELHPLELAELHRYRESERVARSGAERIVALGPMPPHTCSVSEHGFVHEHNDCPHGCRPNEPRRESA
jgi:hypothetical protein